MRLTKYVRQAPNSSAQHALLYLDHLREILYGGAAGGGKSSALLAASLQYVDVPRYSALLVRRTFRDLDQPGALIPRSKEWLSGTDAVWNGNDHRWTFPSGATLTFGYLDHEDDKYQYQGADFQFVGVDELTQFTLTQYTYLFSRCRRPELPDDATPEEAEAVGQLADVPLRVRAASNPGGSGHDWVKERFGIYRKVGEPPTAPYVCHRPEWQADKEPHKRNLFIPAKASDNPHLDVETYNENLDELDHHTRAQLRDGDWDSRPPGDLFRRQWFERVPAAPEDCKWVRFWDLAATQPSESNPDPDYTVGLRLGRHPNGTYYVEHVNRFRKMPKGVKDAGRAMADRDGVNTAIVLEQEPGSSGKTVVHDWQSFLDDRNVRGKPSTGTKWNRASVVSSAAERGLIKLVEADWNAAFLDELEAFTETDDHAHDDQVDALSGAYEALAKDRAMYSVDTRPSAAEPVYRSGDITLVGDKYIDKD